MLGIRFLLVSPNSGGNLSFSAHRFLSLLSSSLYLFYFFTFFFALFSQSGKQRNEKIDFLNDHVSQLTEELKKKAKLIQSYMVREQHGRMKPPGKEQEIVHRVNNLLNGVHVNAPGKSAENDSIHSTSS